MLGSPAGPGGASQRGLWPLAPAPAPTASTFTTDGFSRYGIYSLFQGGAPNFGGALYSHSSTIGRFAAGPIPPTSGGPFHTGHKESLFAPGYTFGAPTPPPGSPYSPVATAPLEFLTKGYNSNIIIQQPEFPLSPKKIQVLEKRCDEKCFNIKTEKACSCQASPTKTKFLDSNSGCSRTNPIEWGPVNVKKEPGLTPCQVAEITTSVSPIVKVEVTSPIQKNTDVQFAGIPPVVTTNGNIPVGIAVARQRVQQHEIVSSPSLPPAGLLTTLNTTTQIKEVSRISEFDSTPGMAAGTTGGVAGGGTLLQCTEDRTAGLAGWSVGGPHNSALTAPTLWQYPALPMEPMVPLPLPGPPVGVQLVRDPTSGHLLLLPTTGIEQVHQAVVWPSYHQPPSVLLPPLPPPPLQLLSSASSDYLSSSTTLHQHTQTHSTRLVALTTDNKRKIPLQIPTTTIIKIETDATTLDQTKTLQAVSTIASSTGTVFTDQSMAPLVTTHVIYQHPTNLILSQPQATETSCRSQATSPVACLTPPPESALTVEEEVPGVQDASNQTDTPICSEDDNTTHTISDVASEVKLRIIDENDLKEDKKIQEQFTLPMVTTEHMQEITKHAEIFTDNLQQSNLSSPPETIRPEDDDTSKTVSDEAGFKPDISGLELLSNSIVVFENCRKSIKNVPIKKEKPEAKAESTENGDEVLKRIEHMSLKDKDTETAIKTPVDNLGGLDLLCALAEQRIMEEKDVKPKAELLQIRIKQKSKDWEREERRKEKRKSKRYTAEHRSKKLRTDDEYKKRVNNEKDRIRKNKRDIERTKQSVLKRVANERGVFDAAMSDSICDNYKSDRCSENVRDKCSCKEYDHRTYKSRESEEEVRKFIASKSQPTYNREFWPTMNAMELDMRMRLAELQRQYKEKQRELSKLKPKRKSEDRESKTRKSRKKSTYSDRSATPPPLLDKMDVPIKPNRNVNDLLKPPTLCAFGSQESLKLPKLDQIKQPDYISESAEKRYSPSLDIGDSTPEKTSSSKKRKVGRPKKLLSSPGLRITTETIVAKKPKKNSFVGYLLAAKQKLQLQAKGSFTYSSSPPRYIEETAKKNKPYKNKNNNITHVSTEIKDTPEKSCKIRPKLKAEPTVKTYSEDEEGNNEWEEPMQTTNDNSEIAQQVQDPEELPTKEAVTVYEQQAEGDQTELEEPQKDVDNRCILTAQHLETDKMRVLTAMGGLFYAGHLNAVEPPDVYSITLDGERGNRPHIMSREEILRDAIVEVSPATTTELIIGTRLCAYWSQQYRCLYPGSVAEPGTPDPVLDSKFVAVEFDDGDSGRIALEDIRLLPPDYPIIEYDPNPLLSLSKRRRRTSVNSASTEERRLSHSLSSPIPTVSEPLRPKVQIAEKENKDVNKVDTNDQHRERKRLKKKKRDKLKQKLAHNDKKKRKKHKCGDEHCKHKKHHKKHRKHKKHHYSKDIVEDKQETDACAKPTNLEQEGNPDTFPDYHIVINPEDEVTMDDIIEAVPKTSKKIRDRQESCESRSKMTAFLPARQLWSWSGKGYKRPRAKGRSRKQFYKAIQRGKETITVGDSAVFLSTGRPDRPYIGRIEAMWELCSTMVVKVKWFYHPEETVGCPLNLQYPGALFESPHVDENDVQTISHKCEVLPLKDYREKLGDDPKRYATIYDNNDIYYLAGHYDPSSTTLKMEPEIPFQNSD